MSTLLPRKGPTALLLLGLMLGPAGCRLAPLTPRETPSGAVGAPPPARRWDPGPVGKVEMTRLEPKQSAEIELDEVARQLTMTVKIDMKQGRRILVKGRNQVVITPGALAATVNGAPCRLSAPVMWRSGVLMAPRDLTSTLRKALKSNPAVELLAWKPAALRKPTVTKTKPASAQVKVSAPGLPSGWNFPANRSWRYIVIHHSATKEGGARSFHRSHARKWKYGLGYHFVIGNGTESGMGEVEIGTRWKRQNQGIHGAHAGVKRYNQAGIGICLVGNFKTGRPRTTQIAALRELCQALMKRYGIPASRVMQHKDVKKGHTECPGKNFPWRSFKASLGG